MEEGETSSTYFLRLEKKRAVDRWIPALRESGGSIVSSPEGLCRTLNTFYSDLFSSVPTDSVVQSSLLSNFPCPLPCDEARLCEGPLTPHECLCALKGMAKNKAPGLDGLPVEFYLRFWHVLGGDLVAVLNSCSLSGSLALSQPRGIITLSFKKGDRLDPRNWCLITLLNVDYKIASRVIAGRLLKVIHLVVNSDQTCWVPGRFIGENVAFLCDVVHYASSSGAPVAILSLDQEKAFDRVDWGFMRSTLSAMGFGPSFIPCVNLFYFHVQSSVNVNGYLSPFFALSRGVRQGCPLSPLLYVLVSEVLAINIRRNPRVSGLSLPGFSPIVPHFPIRRRHVARLDIGRIHQSVFRDVRTVRSSLRCQVESLEVQRPVAGGVVRSLQPPCSPGLVICQIEDSGCFHLSWQPRRGQLAPPDRRHGPCSHVLALSLPDFLR